MMVQRVRRTDISRRSAAQLCSLWAEVWPTDDQTSIDERTDAFLVDRLPEQRMEPESELFHLVEEDGAVLAVARTYVRKMQFEAAKEMLPVLALASVCSSPQMRGRGLGKLVVLDAFSRLDEELPWCLFQTGVPEFYEALGAFRVLNDFRNSFGQDSEATPWWDEHVMVRGLRRNWPTGRVDLCGPAY